MKYITFEKFGHLLMFIGAIATTFNIGHYLSKTHSIIFAYSLGFLLGFALMYLANVASKQNDNRIKLWCSVGLVALMSGTLQYLSYAETIDWSLALLLGYGIPITCEVAISLAISSYLEFKVKEQLEKDKKRRANMDAIYQEKSDDLTFEIVSTHQSKAARDFIANQMDALIIDKAKKSIEKSLAPIEESEITKTKVPYQVARKQERIKKFAYHLADHYNEVETNVLPIKDLSIAFNVKPETIRTWIKELTQADLLNGHVDAKLMKTL